MPPDRYCCWCNLKLGSAETCVGYGDHEYLHVRCYEEMLHTEYLIDKVIHPEPNDAA